VLADRKAITTGSAPSAYATTHTSKLITAWARTSRSARKSIDTPHPRYAFPRRAWEREKTGYPDIQANTDWARTSRSGRKPRDTPHPEYAFPRRAWERETPTFNPASVIDLPPSVFTLLYPGYRFNQ
jgi:hypothetical protein